MPKAGLYEGGLLNALIGAAIPPFPLIYHSKRICLILSLSVPIALNLAPPLTPY